MAKSNETLYLIDGSAIAYRAYFAFIRNPLFNSKGENTSACFGFVNSVIKIINDESPDYIAVVFDTKAPTFRHKMYKEYKSTRAKMPDDMVVQLPRIHQAVEALNIPSIAKDGYEADDIIATLAKQAAAKGLTTVLVTGDKDFFQLVDDRITIYTPQRGSEPPLRLDRKGVKKKFGIYPEQVIDFLALTGDSSDNVPGIPGVGPKTAISLLDQFKTLDDILDNAEEIKAKGVRKKVLENRESAELSRRLVTIDTEVSLDVKIPELKYRPPDLEKSKKLFTELEFYNLLSSLFGEQGVTAKAKKEPSHDYILVSSVFELKKVVKELSAKKEIAVDTETDSLDSLTANLVGISLCGKAGKAYYLPIGHEDEEKNLPTAEVKKILGPLLKNPDVQKIAQNFKYDLQVLENAGHKIAPISFDTFLAAYILNPSARQYSLDALALKHFGHRMIPISDLIGSGKKQRSFATVPVETAADYAAEDADYTFRLRGVFAPQLEEMKLANLYYNVEVPLIEVLSAMEREGIRVDIDFMASLSKKYAADIDNFAETIYTLAGTEFNINSTQQLAKVLFEDLKLPTRGKTAKKTGYATDVRVLEELAAVHPLPSAVLEYRQLTKLKSTYVDAIPALVNPETGRVHTSFNQTIAATGRLSSTDPNLQNIPVRTALGREIRKGFIARDDQHVLVVADYSQIELRILAHYSGDKGLIAAFKRDEDIHSRTAAEVYGVELSAVTPEQRRAAKTANFAVIYGVSAYGLAQQTELDLAGAKQFIDTYFERYPGIRKYMDETIAQARKDGYVTTLLGRRRYLPEINSKNFQVRQFAERTAINTPIQGTAADMIKTAMIRIHCKLKGKKSKMVLQVHDELIFDAHANEVKNLSQLVEKEMSGAMKMAVPIMVEVGTGPNWLEAK